MNEPSSIAMPRAPFPRRAMLRMIGGAGLAVVPALTLAGSASAGRTWCRTDPVLKIDGQVVDLFITSYPEMDEAASGPTQIDVLLPLGSEGSVQAVDRGFGGHGYTIAFGNSNALAKSGGHTQVQISVYQPAADKNLPVRLEFTPRSTGALTSAANATGRANKWVVLKTS